MERRTLLTFVALALAGQTCMPSLSRDPFAMEGDPRDSTILEQFLPAWLPAQLRQLHRADAEQARPPVRDAITSRVPPATVYLSDPGGAPPTAHRPIILSPSSSPFVIDSAIAFSTTDTLRHIYTFTSTSAMASHLTQRLTTGRWVDLRRERYAYDAANRMMSIMLDYPSDDTLATMARWLFTYSAAGDLVTAMCYEWDVARNTWSLFYNYIFTYDAHGNILLDQKETIYGGQTGSGTRRSFLRDAAGNVLEELSEIWQNGWVATGRATSSWDARGRLLSRISDRWQSGQWVPTSSVTFTYARAEEYLTAQWDEWANGQWQPVYREINTFDELDNITCSIIQREEAGTLINNSRLTWTYEGRRSVMLVTDSWADSTWRSYSRIAYTYDARGNRTGSAGEQWDGQAWSNSGRDSTGYDAAGRRTFTSTDHWQNGGWELLYFDTLAYDAGGNTTLDQSENWNAGVQTFGHRNVSTFDPSGNPSSVAYDRWNNGRWTPTDMIWWIYDSARVQPRYSFTSSPHNVYSFEGHRVELRGHTILLPPVETAPFAFTLEQNYPNPFNAGTIITYTLSDEQNTRIAIYDLLGREVARPVNAVQGPGVYQLRFDASGLASGVYLSVLTAGDRRLARKMLLLR